MTSNTRLALLGAITLAAIGSTGCSGSKCSGALFAEDAPGAGGDSRTSPAPSMNAGAAAPADASRAIAEADIIQLDGGRLYAMSKSGSVAIVDVSVAGRLALLGKATIAGEPFEMYRRGDILLTMANGAAGADGTIKAPATSDGYAPPSSDTDSAVVTALDVHDPANIKLVAQFVVSGEIADSRIVGNVLYLATYQNDGCYQCGSKPLTMVTSFDVSDPTSLRKVDQASFQSNAPDSYNLAWGMAWKRSIFVNDQRLYVGGHADFDPNGTIDSSTQEGIVDVLDITDPTGHLVRGAHLSVPGAVLSRWQMDETNGVFRVISQRGAGRTANGVAMPSVDTFQIASTSTMTPLGHGALTLPRQEGLRTVRFDGTRAYAITFNQTDPLFAIDLSNPAAPAQRGQLQMPGWMFYLEPHGDRVIGLGVDRTDPNGSLNVSLFDVSDMTTPKMLKRVAFGGTGLGEDYAITNYEIPEDQDRIQKAFKSFSDGLVVVPFSGASGFGGSSSGQCETPTGGVQLIDWSNDTLTKKALLPMAGNPRRAFEKDTQLIAVSDSNVRSFALASTTSTSTPAPTADLVIGACVPKTQPNPGGMEGEPVGDGYDQGMGGRDYVSGDSSSSVCE